MSPTRPPRPERHPRWEEDDDDDTELEPLEESARRPRAKKGMPGWAKALIAFAVVFVVLGGVGVGILVLVNLFHSAKEAIPDLPVAEVERPSVPPGRGAPAGGGAPARMAPETLQQVKDATVFITVETPEYLATGSGFVLRTEGDTAWVVTNEHVVAPPPERRFGFGPNFPRPPRFGRPIGPRFGPQGPMGPQGPFGPRMPFGPGGMMGGQQKVDYTAIFYSGTPSEVALPAEVVGFTKDPDLAIVKVRGLKNPPAPLDVSQGGQIMETTPILFLGFPFGHALALDKGNPAVSVGQGSVTSIRRGVAGHAMVVIIEGELNPGNSGGPVVDLNGSLIGIAFAKVQNTRIGLAIHRNELAQVQKTRMGGMAVATQTINGETEFRLEVEIFDPMETVPEINLLYLTGQAPAPATDPQTDWQPLPNAVRLPMRRQGVKVIASLHGQAAVELSGRSFTYQFACRDATGKIRYTEPKSFHGLAAKPPAEKNQPPAEKNPRPAERRRADRGDRVPPARPGMLPPRPQQPGSGFFQVVLRTIGKITPPKEIPGLLAYWNFDEGQGETTKDASGKGNDAQLHDTQWVEGVQGKALQFDGTASYVDFGKAPALNFPASGEFTFGVWIKTAASGGTFLSLRNSQRGAPVIDLRLENGGWLVAEIRDDKTESKSALHLRSGIVNDGSWHHIALVRQADGVCILYVDGDLPVKHMFPASSLQAHFSTSGPITTDLRAWGCERYWAKTGRAFGPTYFSGCLDEACIFNRALTTDELKNLAGVEEGGQ
jgi:S1-C subfamily serine protease